MVPEQIVVVRRRLDAAGLTALAVGGGRLTLDLAQLEQADLATVDLLARLHLAAARAGGVLALRNVPAQLAELLRLAGLAGVLA